MKFICMKCLQSAPKWKSLNKIIGYERLWNGPDKMQSVRMRVDGMNSRKDEEETTCFSDVSSLIKSHESCDMNMF
jgi:hypothetical protein